MYHKLLIFFLLLILSVSCSKKEAEIDLVLDASKAYEVYEEAYNSMQEGEFLYASKKFSEAESLFIEFDNSAKAALMSSYCLYIINFYSDAEESLERFVSRYPANKDIVYAHYLIALTLYEQILDEKKDLKPLIKTKDKINFVLNNYPNSDYALDLKFKLGLIDNQLAAKELYVAKYYIKTQKWVPAVNRLKIIVNDYEKTIFVEEALHRLVEIYYKIGFVEEAQAAAALLGYNYNSSEWYARSYKVLNKEYKIPTQKNNKKKEGKILKNILKKLQIKK